MTFGTLLQRPMIAVSLAALLVASAANGQNNVDTPSDFDTIDRDLEVRDSQKRVRTRIDSTTGDWRSITPQGTTAVHVEQNGANIFAGGNGTGDDGDVVLFSETSQNQAVNNASIHLDGGAGAIRLGGGGEQGRMVVRSANNAQRILLDGQQAQVIVGNQNRRGRLFVRNAAAENTVAINGANGQIRGNQIVSRHDSDGGQSGIDTASVFIESRDPAIALRDTTGNNLAGWYVQSSSTGRLLFHTGTTATIGNPVMVLDQDGGICLGKCD